MRLTRGTRSVDLISEKIAAVFPVASLSDTSATLITANLPYIHHSMADATIRPGVPDLPRAGPVPPAHRLFPPDERRPPLRAPRGAADRRSGERPPAANYPVHVRCRRRQRQCGAILPLAV